MGCPCSSATNARQAARQQQRTSVREPRDPAPAPRTALDRGYYWTGPARKEDPAPAADGE